MDGSQRESVDLSLSSSSVGSTCSTPRLFKTDSTLSLSSSFGGIRPSLVWMFDHIRPEDRECLIKEDLRPLVSADVNSEQLDEAFDKLDINGDGEISLDEFIKGFASFMKSTPQSLKPEKKLELPPPEVDHYETDATLESPPEKLNNCLSTLSSHNRQSIETLWSNLNQSNPELLPDFEDFVAELATEVQTAQKALDTQRLAIKREAVELDQEIESRLDDAKTTLQVQTNLVKQQVRARLETQLADREGELMMVKSQLGELEDEVVATQQMHTELQQQIEALNQEKAELNDRLEESEKRFLESQSTVATIESNALKEVEQQQEELHYHEEELLKQKRTYEESIAKLKEQLALHTQTPPEPRPATPELVITGTPPRPASSNSLRDEIVQKDGLNSPMIRRERVLEPSPFRERSRTVVKKASSIKKLKPKGLMAQSNLSMSLPDLADVDELDNIPLNKKVVYLPVYVSGEPPKKQSDSEGFLPQETPVPNEPPIPKPRLTIDPSSGQPPPDFNTTPTQPSNSAPLVNAPVTPAPVKAPTPGAKKVLSRPAVKQQQPPRKYEHVKDERCMPIEFVELGPGRKPDYHFKIIIIGDSYVGKTSYLERMCSNGFSQAYNSTIGVDFKSKYLRTEDMKVVALQIWDTAGQERFRSICKPYYRGIDAVIIMYDICLEGSFLSVKSWVSNISANGDGVPPKKVLIVGNKFDLAEKTKREVSTESGQSLAESFKADFIETSAMTGYNVADSLLMLVRGIKDHVDGLPAEDNRRVEQFQLEPPVSLADKSNSGKKKESFCSCSKD